MSSELTYISAAQVNSYTSIDALKIDIIKTLARWFSNYYVYNEHALESWIQREGTDIYVLYNSTFQFELSHLGANVYELTMYAVGRFRRNGSSCDFFERVLDGLEQQLGHPDIEFITILEANSSKAAKKHIDFGISSCLTYSSSPLPNAIADSLEVSNPSTCGLTETEIQTYLELYTVASDSNDESSDHEDSNEEDSVAISDDEDSVASSDEDSEDEDEVIMSIPLPNMTDLQIEKYCELIGRCPRDECSEWDMVYNGGDIIRYSYCKFIQWGIEDQTVSNITISNAIFDQVTFTNYLFDNVTFEECVFKDIILNNTTFKNSKFIDCELDISISLDKSCSVENYDYQEDNVTYRFC
jgi:hypothetical protein